MFLCMTLYYLLNLFVAHGPVDIFSWMLGPSYDPLDGSGVVKVFVDLAGEYLPKTYTLYIYHQFCHFRLRGLVIKELGDRCETEIVGFSYGEFDRHGEFLL